MEQEWIRGAREVVKWNKGGSNEQAREVVMWNKVGSEEQEMW